MAALAQAGKARDVAGRPTVAVGRASRLVGLPPDGGAFRVQVRDPSRLGDGAAEPRATRLPAVDRQEELGGFEQGYPGAAVRLPQLGVDLVLAGLEGGELGPQLFPPGLRECAFDLGDEGSLAPSSAGGG